MKNIKPQDVQEYLEKYEDTVVIDVRTPLEWEGGIPDCAKLELLTITPDMDMFAENLTILVPSKEHHVIFICKGGARSATAALLAERVGYKKCYNVQGGFEEWKALGLQVRSFK
ncbi:MAG: hypothetical protein RLZZ59_692 [Pseudomonadota bacterium]|jgi:rhodanese-related sulfurtransferase